MTAQPETASKWVEEMKQLINALTIHGPAHWSTPVHAERVLLLLTAQDALMAQLAGALEDLFGADMEHVLMGDGKEDQVRAIEKARAALAAARGER